MKRFLIIERGVGGRETPAIYHDEVPYWMRQQMVWGMRLDEPHVAELPIDVLYQRYKQSVALGALPESNLAASDYWTRTT